MRIHPFRELGPAVCLTVHPLVMLDQLLQIIMAGFLTKGDNLVPYEVFVIVSLGIDMMVRELDKLVVVLRSAILATWSRLLLAGAIHRLV